MTSLVKALKRDNGAGVRSLRCDAHEKDDTCWLPRHRLVLLADNANY